jgi:hypothetical protein
MKVWSFYRPEDGLFTGQILSGSDTALADNLPPDLEAIEGRYDRICQRVEAGKVVDHQPSQPDSDHEWRAEFPDAPDRANQRWRWIKRPDVLALERSDMTARVEMRELELQSLRALREAVLPLVDPDSAAGRRLLEIEQEVNARRGDVLPPRPQGR